MQTLGKLSAEELNQMAESGINARKYLSDAFGMTVEEIQKAKIDIDQIVGAIWKGLDADYDGGAKRAQASWSGMTATFKSYITEISRTVMASGVFDEMKDQLSGINVELKDWIKNNEDLIQQKVPEYIAKTKDSLKNMVGIYNSLPDGVVGAAGVGIVGRIITGSSGLGATIGGLYLLNEQLNTFDSNLGSIAESWKKYAEHERNILDVFTGKRHWDTGALRDDPAVLEARKKHAAIMSGAGVKFENFMKPFVEPGALENEYNRLNPSSKKNKIAPPSTPKPDYSALESSLEFAPGVKEGWTDISGDLAKWQEAEDKKIRAVQAAQADRIRIVQDATETRLQQDFASEYEHLVLGETDSLSMAVFRQAEIFKDAGADRVQVEQWVDSEIQSILKESAAEQESIKQDLTDRINQLTMTEVDYQKWVLDQEIENLLTYADENKQIQDLVTDYQIAKTHEILEAHQDTNNALGAGHTKQHFFHDLAHIIRCSSGKGTHNCIEIIFKII